MDHFKGHAMMGNGHPHNDPNGRGLHLSRDAWGRLVLIDRQGARHVGVQPVRAFPFSEPHGWISLCDTAGHEVASIESLAELPPQTRTVLLEELDRRQFLPTIVAIHGVSGISEPCEWDVDTDRGPTRFVLNNEDDVRRLGPHRALITDAQGVRYQIRDSQTLNPGGRRIIERYL